nr:MAG TPA: hypothetical protein [Caudoviricetes sp.]
MQIYPFLTAFCPFIALRMLQNEEKAPKAHILSQLRRLCGILPKYMPIKKKMLTLPLHKNYK